MTRRRFYAPPDVFADGSVNLGDEETRHLRSVLRLGPGDEIFVFDGEGREFQCVIEESRRSSTAVRVLGEASPDKPESALDLQLSISLLKGEKFDLVVQKAVELGVANIQPVITGRADVRLKDEDDAVKRMNRWQRIALEAAKQSGRARVPRVGAPVSFQSLIGESLAAAKVTPMLRLMFAERDGESLAQVTKKLDAAPGQINALVGSEGGWTDEEIEMARGAGWQIVTLGGRTLRAETAAIAVAALLQHRFGDLV